jgi:hypothetical protein
MPALYKNGKNYSHNGPQVDVELTKGSPNAAPSGKVYDKIEEIQSQIVPTASIEIGDTASKAYNAGDFLVKDGILYKVTKAIAKNDALTVGENIAMTTVCSELSGLTMITIKSCVVKTEANKVITMTESSIIDGSVPMDNKAIPVIVGLSKTSECFITIHFNMTAWRIYSNATQNVYIKWYVINV